MSVSFYISNTSVKAVSGKSGRKKVIVKNAYKENIPEGLIINGIITDETALSDVIKNFKIKHKINCTEADLVVSGKNIMCKTAKIPPATRNNIIKLVQSEYSDLENPENYIFDYTVINPLNEDNTATVLACAADRDMIASYINLFNSAGIKLSSINTDVNSQIKLMRNFIGLEKSTYLLAVADGNILSVTLFAGGIFSFSNRSRLMEDRGTEAVINEFARIISSFMQFSKAQKNKSDITDVYFCGMNKYEANMCSQISDLLEIHVSALPECPVTISSLDRNFSISEYIYSVGNLIKL
jgi:hypothetical protein